MSDVRILLCTMSAEQAQKVQVSDLGRSEDTGRRPEGPCDDLARPTR